RKHVLMWWLAGGATLLGASLTYLATRPAVAPVVARAQASAARLRESRIWEHGVWAVKELSGRVGEKISDLLRKDSAGRGAREKPVVCNSAFEGYRATELARLEEEERAFHDYLERLRTARDKEEFEAFMRDRQTR